jgi:uncharacterized protein YerC
MPLACGRRLLIGPFETRAQLRDEVLKLLESGQGVTEIASQFGVSISTISRIKHGDRSQTVHGYRVPTRRRT